MDMYAKFKITETKFKTVIYGKNLRMDLRERGFLISTVKAHNDLVLLVNAEKQLMYRYRSICLSIFLSVYPSIIYHLSIHLSLYPSIYLSIYLSSIYLNTQM
jgi:hypothetical protein